MHRVEISVCGNELSATMAAMRLWLDERRCEPAVFSCRDEDKAVVVRLNFLIADEAAAFAARFGGAHAAPPAVEAPALPLRAGMALPATTPARRPGY